MMSAPPVDAAKQAALDDLRAADRRAGQHQQVAARIPEAVDVVALEAAFAEIDAQYGNFDSYVREGLGLSESDVRKLRDQLLE